MADIVTVEFDDTVTYPGAGGFTIEVASSAGPEFVPDVSFALASGSSANAWTQGAAASVPGDGTATIPGDFNSAILLSLSVNGISLKENTLYEIDIQVISEGTGEVEIWDNAVVMGITPAWSGSGPYTFTTNSGSQSTFIYLYYTSGATPLVLDSVSIREPASVSNAFTIGLIDPPTGGSDVITFTSDVAGWTPPLALGDVPVVSYDSVGNNLADSDGKRLKSQSFPATNCLKVQVTDGWAGNRDCG